MPSLSLDSWVISGRHRHHRERDHFGADSDLYVALAEPVGQWNAGTPIKYVIADLYERIVRLASHQHNIRVAWMDAYILAPTSESGGLGVKHLDALVFASRSSSFTVRAMVTDGGVFTIDAYVLGYGEVYLNAFVI